jgi:CheY-like chemotaxis protein
MEDDQAVVRIRDNGVGITPELLPRIFDLFVQGSRSLDRSEGGLGIGLALVREIVRLHGGTVSAASEGVGQGSEFTVRLPLLADFTAQPRLDTDAASASGPRRRILVVDDNRDSASSLALLLGTFGHEVHIAHDGPEALQRAREYRPDTILLDIGLPGMSGYEVASEMREIGALRGAMLIAVTGYGQEDDRKRSRDAGFDHHLVKPVDAAALAEILSSTPKG